MDSRPSIEALELGHAFPGEYHFKVIGAADDRFEERVLAAVSSELAEPTDLSYNARTTPGGRHIALTLVVRATSAEQVRAIYAKVHKVEGLSYLL